MDNFNKERLEDLLRKFGAGTCTPEEELMLNRWLNGLNENPDQPAFKIINTFRRLGRTFCKRYG